VTNKCDIRQQQKLLDDLPPGSETEMQLAGMFLRTHSDREAMLLMAAKIERLQNEISKLKGEKNG
jgi:hypothetical protein